MAIGQTLQFEIQVPTPLRVGRISHIPIYAFLDVSIAHMGQIYAFEAVAEILNPDFTWTHLATDYLEISECTQSPYYYGWNRYTFQINDDFTCPFRGDYDVRVMIEAVTPTGRHIIDTASQRVHVSR